MQQLPEGECRPVLMDAEARLFRPQQMWEDSSSEQAIKAVRQVECIHHADRVQHGNNIESPAAKKNCATRQIKGRDDRWVRQIEKEPSCCCLNQEFLVATQSVISAFDLFSPVVQK